MPQHTLVRAALRDANRGGRSSVVARAGGERRDDDAYLRGGGREENQGHCNQGAPNPAVGASHGSWGCSARVGQEPPRSVRRRGRENRTRQGGTRRVLGQSQAAPSHVLPVCGWVAAGALLPGVPAGEPPSALPHPCLKQQPFLQIRFHPAASGGETRTLTSGLPASKVLPATCPGSPCLR